MTKAERMAELLEKFQQRQAEREAKRATKRSFYQRNAAAYRAELKRAVIDLPTLERGVMRHTVSAVRQYLASQRVA